MSEWMIYEIELQQPAIITARTQYGQYIQCLDYIPGTTVAGAISAWLEQNMGMSVSKQREIWLGEAPCIIGPAYPEAPRASGISKPVPLSVWKCKRVAGMGRDDSATRKPWDLPHHGFIDTVVADLLVARNAQAPVRLDRCSFSSCNAPLERYGASYYMRSEKKDETGQIWGQYEEGRARRRLRSHVGISRTRYASAQGILFATEELLADQGFRGLIRLGALADIVGQRGRIEDLSIGNSRSRGYGKVSFSIAERTVPLGNRESLCQRIRGLNNAVTKAGNGAAEGRVFFTVTLLSHAVLLSADGRPQVGIQECHLPAPFSQEARLELQYHRGVQIEGWNGLWRLPRPPTLATAAGSVAVFSVCAEWWESNQQAAVEGLAAIERNGLGVAVREGWGLAEVAAHIHWEGPPSV
jgi:CRISPR-associated Csx10 family RAMP protein